MDDAGTAHLIANADLKPLVDLLRPVLEGMGFDLIRLTRSSGEDDTLQILTERGGGGEMAVKDCAAISRAVGTVLDEHDPIVGAYMLEVSSPGIDRPLTRARDFETWKGFQARCVTKAGAVEGRIAGIGPVGLSLARDGTDMTIALADLIEARLVFNDELLQATRKVAPAA